MKKLILLPSLFLLSASAFAINERGEYEEKDFKENCDRTAATVVKYATPGLNIFSIFKDLIEHGELKDGCGN
ncbi:hypothetical protein [Yersinia similis]|uniref:Uncharacterized protein n=2 Tax=Yersinia similis TaxID=367190 RepID=A0A0T9Q635_9GAMM|nr:hypothetical protein [Yersinia similis]AHK21227.1 hypothetical protein BF17_19610 [Yersinia similis]CFQ65996.1 Uncharacterised protein [Yersinia similis]CNF31875.1 Uncharacterised protein [Yersinia similis]CNF35819.1 Uncharacterised protein [Yersinia similis]CNH97665.1 Uncharacterised protein [Yersinia similis]